MEPFTAADKLSSVCPCGLPDVIAHASLSWASLTLRSKGMVYKQALSRPSDRELSPAPYLHSFAENKSSYCLGLFVGMMLIFLSLSLGSSFAFPTHVYFQKYMWPLTLTLNGISCLYEQKWYFKCMWYFSSVIKNCSVCKQPCTWIQTQATSLKIVSSSIVQVIFSCWRLSLAVYNSYPVSVIHRVCLYICFYSSLFSHLAVCLAIDLNGICLSCCLGALRICSLNHSLMCTVSKVSPSEWHGSVPSPVHLKA